MRAPEAEEAHPLHEYTLMPTHMQHAFRPEELRGTEMAPPFSFTKGCPVMKIDSRSMWKGYRGRHPDTAKTLLFDLEKDPGQERPCSDPKVERRMVEHLVRMARECDAPPGHLARLGLPAGR